MKGATLEQTVIIGSLTFHQNIDGSLGVVVDAEFCIPFADLGDACYEIARMEGEL